MNNETKWTQGTWHVERHKEQTYQLLFGKVSRWHVERHKEPYTPSTEAHLPSWINTDEARAALAKARGE